MDVRGPSSLWMGPWTSGTGLLREQTEQVTGSKAVNRIPPCPCSVLASRPEFLPWCLSVMECNLGAVSQINFLPQVTLGHAVHHSNREQTMTVTNVFFRSWKSRRYKSEQTCHLPLFTPVSCLWILWSCGSVTQCDSANVGKQVGRIWGMPLRWESHPDLRCYSTALMDQFWSWNEPAKAKP